MNVSRYIRRDLDLGLLASVLVAMTIGITMIYSATFDWDLKTAGSTYQKQIVWALLAVVGMVVTLQIPLKIFYAFAYIIYGLAMVVLATGLETSGSGSRLLVDLADRLQDRLGAAGHFARWPFLNGPGGP